MAFVATAALITGEAAGVVAVVAAAAEIATFMTVAGAVTGNEDLMKIGGAIGLAAGVGGLAAGAIGAAGTEVAGSALADSGWSSAMDTAGDAGLSSANQLADSGLQDAVSKNVNPELTGLGDNAPSTITGTGLPAPEEALKAPTAQATGAEAVQSPQQVGTANADTDVNMARATDSVDANAAKLDVSSPADIADPYANETAKLNRQDIASPAGTGKQPAGSYLDSFLSFAEKNGKLLNTGATLLSGGMSGMQKAKQAQQEMDYKNRVFARASEIPAFKYNGIISKAQA